MTTVGIQSSSFLVDGEVANRGYELDGIALDGLLLNSRMINGAFDDSNPDTVGMWAYPDTGRWDPERNTNEFIEAMPQWRADGLNAFTLGVQGGSPQGYSYEQPWDNSGFTPEGHLKDEYRGRLGRIIERADELGLVVILNLFYQGQVHRVRGEEAILRAVEETCQWVLRSGWDHVLIDVANEVNSAAYVQSTPLHVSRVQEVIRLVKSIHHHGRRLLVSTSFMASPPFITPAVLAEADFVLLHGNGTRRAENLSGMVQTIKYTQGYAPKPIMFNEDDHLDFEVDRNHMKVALEAGASWGHFDPGSVTTMPPKPTRGDYRNGYQAVPINWSVSTDRKRSYFEVLRRIRRR